MDKKDTFRFKRGVPANVVQIVVGAGSGMWDRRIQEFTGASSLHVWRWKTKLFEQGQGPTSPHSQDLPTNGRGSKHRFKYVGWMEKLLHGSPADWCVVAEVIANDRAMQKTCFCHYGLCNMLHIAKGLLTCLLTHLCLQLRRVLPWLPHVFQLVSTNRLVTDLFLPEAL